jgi:hypothetical protein
MVGQTVWGELSNGIRRFRELTTRAMFTADAVPPPLAVQIDEGLTTITKNK